METRSYHNSDMGNRSAKNAGREGGIAPGTVADSAGQYT
jgi:hypothetical protein